MIQGHFSNCYGLKSFEMPKIDFSQCNRAVIYAPNGVMKSSLSKVFEDISKGQATNDRIFKNNKSVYSVTHYTSQYQFNGAKPKEIPIATENVYVINSFADKFEFTKETVGTLLADEITRNRYSVIVSELSNEISKLENDLKNLTGLTKPKIKEMLIADFELPIKSEWTDIVKKLNDCLTTKVSINFFDGTLYSEIFHEKVLAIYEKDEFKTTIEEYITSLNTLLSESKILSEHFNEKNAEDLTKGFEKHNLFEAKHAILLRDGRKISSLSEWNNIVSEELKELYEKPKLSTEFAKLKKLLTANADVLRARDIITSHREIIPFLLDIANFKKQVWLHNISKLEVAFEEYYMKIFKYYDEIKELYEKAAEQSERWNAVVNEFNRRFRVPFKVKINNKASFLLKDEAPNLTFEYSRGHGTNMEYADVGKDDLMVSLSMGERRALYLLYILFDLDKIRKKAEQGVGKYLIVADDIADSFDYKNKYAIIEYLHNLSKATGIDLLVLTHNFDFYRTLKFRLDIKRDNCYIAQKNIDNEVNMTVFKYQKDFFKNIIVNKIKSGDITSDEAKKLLIASIPFYRNLSDYSGKDVDFSNLTCMLHLKTQPYDTEKVKLSDVWNIIKKYLGNNSFVGNNDNYLTTLFAIADDLSVNNFDDVSLENKLLMSIAIRLKAEQFLKKTIENNLGKCDDSSKNQTRDWYSIASPYLSDVHKSIIDDVHLITPENIHLNAFMYEPIIDISAWVLIKLYNDVKGLI